jgi:hypothetical protein
MIVELLNKVFAATLVVAVSSILFVVAGEFYEQG